MATAERNDEAPNSAPLGAMGSLLRRLDMLPCTNDAGSISELKDYIHSIRDKLKKLSEVQDPPLTVNYWMKHARELSYDIEAYLDGLDAQTEDSLNDSDAKKEDNPDDSDAKTEDSIDGSDDETQDSVDELDAETKDDSVNDSGGSMQHSICGSDNKISGFMTRAEGIKERYARFRLHSVVNCPTATTTIVSPRLRDVVPVGMLGNQITELISRLQPKDKNGNQLKIVSILGDEGIGKSTLVQEIWRESFKEKKIWPEPQSEVKVERAFVRMGKKPDVRMILRSILSQVSQQEPDKDSGVTNLIRDIRKHLEQKRYFIIVDDVRSVSIWDVVGRAFPRCSVGSRIITTTSDKEVALACCSYILEHKYNMKPLSEDDCKELFIRTVDFGSVNLQLSEQVLDEIIQKCGGLPLAIIWTAILVASKLETEQGLSRTEKEQNLDSDVKKFLDENLRTGLTPVEILKQVLKLCYSSLPHCLKTCLLYLSVYPENYFFLKEDLVKLWIAEGFICTSEEDKVEAAGRYFGVLVSLGLIQRMDINRNKQHHQGEVVKDEGEEYPLTVPYVVHPTVFDFITSKSTEDNFITIIDYSQLTIAFKEKIRRLSLHFGSVTYASTPEGIGLSHVRTLSFMGLLSCMPSLVEFKLVRVLILHLWDDDRDNKFSLAVMCRLLLLRYLQVRCNVTVELPGQIGCLKHLETLEINSVFTAVPSDVFHLSRLLHLRLGLKQNLTRPVAAVNAICSDELLPPMDDSSSTSTPSVQIFELMLPICIFSRIPKWIPQLSKLSILEIVVRELFTTDIDMLANLPALTTLFLNVQIPTAGNIVFGRCAFPALKHFRFMCGVLSLEFQEDAVPNLRRINIGFNLQEVVPSIGATMGMEDTDRILAESALKDAINKHRRPTKFNVKREHQVEEEYRPPLDPVSINEQEVPVIHGPKTEDSTNEQPINLDKMPTKDTHEHANFGIPQFSGLQEDDNSSTQQKSVCVQDRGRNENLQNRVNMNTISVPQTIGVISGLNECANLFQWVTSSTQSNERQKQKIQGDVRQLQSDLQCLSDTLPEMYNLIDRAEWRIHDHYVHDLLAKLKDVVYDAEDLLDEFRWYETKVSVEGNEISVEPIIEFFESVTQGSFNTVTNIQKTFNNFSRQLEKMGLYQAIPRFDRSLRPETTSFPTEAKIYGRDEEMEKLITMLGVPTNNSTGPSGHKRKRSGACSSANNQVCATNSNKATTMSVSVLPIVGIGGVGKTTLAQNICNRSEVKRHFDLIIWICVSDHFDVKRLTIEAVEQSYGKVNKNDNLNFLQCTLADSLKTRRFLIVLDDMWDENELDWKRFCAPFRNALPGSMMLVTTRLPNVADVVRTMDPFLLEGLNNDACWKFFKLCVFGSDSSHDDPELERIAQRILPKLRGSPLSAKTLGRLLGMSLDPAHWNRILTSQLWELQQKKTDILPALLLSYMYLPFFLKRCFSFCAMYPKDYSFSKKDLAEIWVAEGLVEHQHIGDQYFDELAHLTFFQKYPRSQEKYVISDLMRDMAQLVSKDECFILKDTKDLATIPQNVRHLVVLKGGDVKCADLLNLCKHRKLRTLICNLSLKSKTGNTVMEKWCAELLCMRVMVCSSISKWGLPGSISNMKHLRYLKILDSCFCKSLPAGFCHLYNMQILYAKKWEIDEMPSGFGMLTNLRKFESVKCNFHHRHHSVYIPGNAIDEGPRSEIIFINYNGESLPSYFCQQNMPHVTSLGVERPENIVKSIWFHSYNCSDSTFSSLTDVQIEGCRNLSSVEQFLQPAYVPNIKKIKIGSCSNLERVPTEKFGDLRFLEALNVIGCPKIKSQRLFAPSLKELYLSNSGDLVNNIECSSLTKFHIWEYPTESIELNMWNLPSLQELVIVHCGSLTIIRDSEPLCTNLFHSGTRSKMGKFPLLTHLSIWECKKLKTIDDLLYLPAIESIKIWACGLQSLPANRLGGSPRLKDLQIAMCPSLNWKSGLLLPSSLQKLKLQNCGDFSGWFPSCLEKLTSLESLEIRDCEYIVCVPGHIWSSNLKSLNRLMFHNCPKLISIGGPNAIAHIRDLFIEGCPVLKVETKDE